MISVQGHEDLLGRISRRTATVCVVGLGYVGCPVLRAFQNAGMNVVGYDINPTRAREVSQMFDVPTYGGERNMPPAEIYIVCVPTPVTGMAPDLRCVRAVAAEVPDSALVVLESTVGPGDTESCFEHVRWLAFSPEREDPGNGRDLTKIPKVMAGRDQKSWDLASLLYANVFDCIHKAPDIRTAEFSKLVENTYRAVNCALANEFKDAALPLGVDVHEAIRLAATKPFGFQAFYPGPGVGGHCVPVDPYYLTNATPARMPLVQQAMRSNSVEPGRVALRIMKQLPPTPTRRPEILMVGVAYKKNIDDVRNSPALALMGQLRDLGAEVAWYDPHVHQAAVEGFKNWHIDYNSQFDAVVLATDHDNVNYSVLDEHPCVFDTRARLVKRKGVIRV